MTEFMNQNTTCIACMKGRNHILDGQFKVNGKNVVRDVPLIKHHVRYDPEIVAYVHFNCHQIIHDPDDPRYKHLIQFQDGESREYYDNK